MEKEYTILVLINNEEKKYKVSAFSENEAVDWLNCFRVDGFEFSISVE